MILPLVVLCIGALLAGYLNWPHEHLSEFLGHSPSFRLAYEVANHSGAEVNAELFGQSEGGAEHATSLAPTPAMIVGAIVAVSGILLAFWLHLADRRKAEEMAAGMTGVTEVLDAKYWVDEIYQAAIVEPLRKLGKLFFAIDRIIVDGLVWLISFIPQLGGFSLKVTMQRGYLQGYAAVMAFGVLAILLFVFL